MIHGIDVSHHNGQIDWVKKKNSGVEFCFVKATEGTGYVDSQFAQNWWAAPVAGVLTGAYCFFHPNQDPITQALHFLRVIGPLKPGFLPPVLDWESLDGVAGKTNVKEAKQWLDTVEKQTKVTPILYASPGFLEGLGDLTGFERYPLWVAHYGVSRPRIPKPWKQWAFWQTSDAGGMDEDLFNGSLEQIQKYCYIR